MDKKILEKLYQVNIDVFEAILSKAPDQIHQAMSQHIDAEHEILWPE